MNTDMDTEQPKDDKVDTEVHEELKHEPLIQAFGNIDISDAQIVKPVAYTSNPIIEVHRVMAKIK